MYSYYLSENQVIIMGTTYTILEREYYITQYNILPILFVKHL